SLKGEVILVTVTGNKLLQQLRRYVRKLET
ncbi:unnamed protein product, partial [Allacma fusca]